ncbi:hypothetical protein GYMLUDRAFT_64766 [Collybiopsis luxurians FD-317 M1]|uniref:Armadillo repeat-containing protein 8 n=1 Tax=Collybiopsis luxurians FD-317 M1 TaxID=944289 RepID=A0A0D0BB54_9AGAR|nr:hypothetical protein GYMLUDRAFT_64766 [Collybiopsis luxurians FD-317 M1]
MTISAASSSSSFRSHPPSLSELKQLKNRVIGTPSAKCRLAQDDGTMKILVGTTMDAGAGDDIRTETAQILASLASLGGHANDTVVLAALIEADALRGCLSALSKTTTLQVKLRLVLVRALSGIAGDLAELVGPSLWGLGAFEDQWLAGPAAQTLEWFFSAEAMDIWVPMLSGEEAGAVANMIGTVVRTQPVRERLCSWRNAGERERKEKRGWEATKAPTSGGYVLRSLLDLARKKTTLGSALFALAALVKDNPTAANELPLPEIVGYAKSRSGDDQLSACLCATHILRASPSGSAPPAADAILSVLMAMITNRTAHSAKAAFILSHLMADSAIYAQLAYDRGALRVLLSILRKLTPPCPPLPALPPMNSPSLAYFTGPEWESWLEHELDQPKVEIRFREAVMLCLASISLLINDIRRALTEDEGETASQPATDAETPSTASSSQSQPALSLILAGLFSPHASLRHAACHVIRALTRSVAVIRTSIIDSGLGWLVFALFMGRKEARPRAALGPIGVKEKEDPRVVNAALRAICNAVCDFSPLKPVYIEHGLIPRLAELIHPPPHSTPEVDPDADSEDGLRFNALWAVKNIVRKSTLSEKKEVISMLGWHRSSKAFEEAGEQKSRLDDLLSTSSPKILEQTLNILRNLSEDEDGISIVMTELDIRHPSSTPLAPSTSSTSSPSSSSSPSGSILLSHLTSILNHPSPSTSTSTSSYTPHTPHTPHVPHTPYTPMTPHTPHTPTDILIQSASLLANLVNSPDLRHHRMILGCPGMVQALRRVLAEQGPEVRRPVVRAVLEMVKVDFGAGDEEGDGDGGEGEGSEVGGEDDDEREGGGGGAGRGRGADREGDEDVDVMGIGYGVGMGRSASGSASASTSGSVSASGSGSGSRPGRKRASSSSTRSTGIGMGTGARRRTQGGLTGAHRILTDAGFVGTLRRIVDQHHHLPLAHHSHGHVGGSIGHGVGVGVGGGGSGMYGHGHGHGHAHGVSSSFGSSSHGSATSSSVLHHHYSVLGFGAGEGGGVGGVGVGVGPGVGAGAGVGHHGTGGIAGNMGREDREDLEVARTALDWLEHGDVYAYTTATYARRASVSVGVGVGGEGRARSGSVDVPDH